MEIVERILGKIVGHELTKEELEMVSGGITCYSPKQPTWFSNNSSPVCDDPA